MIVDWKKNCDSIYESKKLTSGDRWDKKSYGKQKLVYLNFLVKVKKMTREECFEEWKKLDSEKEKAEKFSFSDEELQEDFESFLRLSRLKEYSSMNFRKELKPVKIYSVEMKFINGLNAPLWIRQYWGAMLFYYKFESQNTVRVEKKPSVNSWAINHTVYKDKRYGANCQDEIARYSLADPKNPVLVNFLSGRNESRLNYVPSFMSNRGRIVGVYNSIEEIDDFISLIAPTRSTCSSCGALFETTSKTKRSLCEKCYEEYRRKYNATKEYSRKVKKGILKCPDKTRLLSCLSPGNREASESVSRKNASHAIWVRDRDEMK